MQMLHRGEIEFSKAARKGGLTHGVHRFDLFELLIEVKLDCYHNEAPFSEIIFIVSVRKAKVNRKTEIAKKGC